MTTLPQSINELCSDYSHNFSKKQLDMWSGAVNFIIIQGEVLLIKRCEDVPTHKGQIAFMGGHKNFNEDPISCALREFSEESSVNCLHLTPLGLLPPAKTSKGSLIIPVLSTVNLLKEEFLTDLSSNGEWSEVFTVPLDFFKNRQNWLMGKWHDYQGEMGNILFCPLDKKKMFSVKELESLDYMLWGVTAKIIWNFVGRDFESLPNK